MTSHHRICPPDLITNGITVRLFLSLLVCGQIFIKPTTHWSPWLTPKRKEY